MMKHGLWVGMAVLLGVGMAGCEWEGGGDDNSWNESSGVANFSGTYTKSGGGFVVSLSSSSATTNTVTAAKQIGTGNAVLLHFEGTMDHRPLTKGSVNVTAGVVNLSDPSGSSTLSGANGSGSVNYDTGFVSVNCTVIPGAGIPVKVYYSYSSSFASGEDSGITALNVQQQGTSLKIVDSSGKTYTGNLSGSRTASGATASSAASGDTITSQFEAGGQSASGKNVRMVGTFSATVTGTGAAAVFSNRQMNGTWIEDGGKTAGISATAN